MRHSLLILFIVSTNILYGQCDLKITGQVIDLDDGKELENCLVSILGQTLVVVTNEHGRFQFTNVCEGKAQIIIKHFGCRDTIISVQLTKNYQLKVKLPHSAFELQEVDIMDKRLEMKQTQTVDKLDSKDLQKSTGQTLGDVLKNVTGVTTLNNGGNISKPMIHGMQGYRLLILNNGIRQEGQQWGNEHAPEIDPFMAKSISVIKGANSIRYGSDAIAGVVLVEPNPLPDTAAVNGELNLAGFSNGRAGAGSMMIEGYFDKIKYFSWRVQGSLKKGGNLQTPTYYLRNTGVEEYNYSYAIGYHRKQFGAEMYYSQYNTKIGIYRGSHIGNLSDLSAAYKRSTPIDSMAPFSYQFDRPFQAVAHELIKGSMHYHFTQRWRANVQYAWQYNWRKEYDLHLPKSEEEKALQEKIAQVDYRITSQTIEALVEHDNIRSFRGMFGASYMNQKNVYVGRFFIPYYKNNTWGLFATERYVRQHIEFEVGVRYDQKYLQSFYYKQNDLVTPKLFFSNFTYNGGLIWKPDTTFNLFLNAGSAWRAPAVNELYANGIHHGVSAIERGDENMKTEKVYNVTITGSIKQKNVIAELSLYHNQFSNYIYLDPTGNNELTIRGAYPVFEYRQVNARISGVDLKINWLLSKHFDVTAKGMMVRGWNQTSNDHLILMPADRGDMNLRFKFNTSSVFKENYVQVNNSFVNKQWRVPTSGDFALPPNAYYLLGFEIGSSIKLKKQVMNISFSATNLLNQKYRDYLDRFRYFADAQGVSYNLRISVPLTFYDKKISNN